VCSNENRFSVQTRTQNSEDRDENTSHPGSHVDATALPLRASPDKRKAYPQGRSHCKSDFACQTDFAVNMPAASTHAELLRNMRLLALTLFDGATFLGAIGIDLGARSVAGEFAARPPNHMLLP